MEILRTPDARFDGLPEFPFAPHYAEVLSADGTALRVHYLDEGPRDGHPVIMLHGQPSWCYLYRRIVPVLSAAGLRVLAPDLVGFGRSDKPAAIEDYSYRAHVSWIEAWLRAVDVRPATLIAHDWGGFIGLRVVANNPDRFVRVLASNTGLPDQRHTKPVPLFYVWRDFVANSAELAIGNVIQSGCVTQLPAQVIAAYDAPFPDESFKAGVRAFPTLVPTQEDEPESLANQRAWSRLEQWTRPFLTVFGAKDPINAGSDGAFQRAIPGAAGQPHKVLANAGHFLQEDVPNEFAELVRAFAAQR